MGKVNAKNKAGLESLVKLIEESKDVILINYRGLSVFQLTKLRRQVKKQGATLKITKNNLFKLALKQTGNPSLDSTLPGPTAVLFCKEESGPVVKTLFELMTEYQDKFDIKSGIISGDVFNKSQLEAYSKLPSRNEMIAKLMGTMNAPVQGTATLLSEIIATFMRTLDAYKESKAQ